MLVFSKIQSVKKYVAPLKKSNSIGFVPTMGALHQGHISLVEKAKDGNDLVAVSIFVNPTQFDKEEDLLNYPNTLDSDLDRLQKLGVDLVFVPTSNEVYEDSVVAEMFDFDGLDAVMEGKFRKGHFDGVGTVVKRLLEIVGPDRAYFGEKDYQQLLIIKNMVRKHAIPVEIIGCPIYREADGLAMSSRNMRLTQAQRKAAPLIYKTLQELRGKVHQMGIQEITKWVTENINKDPELKLEYFEIVNETSLQKVSTLGKGKSYRAFIAVFAGKIRLIDNISLQ